MIVPLEITYKEIAKNDEIDNLIRHKVEKLNNLCSYISSCRVLVERPQRHQHTGQPYRIRIDITIPPGHEIVISREPNKSNLHQDLAAEIRWAFNSAAEKIKELMEKQHRDVKTHDFQQTQGIVERLFPEFDHGFIRALDGRELFFHRNSVLHNQFDKIKIGSGVRFTEEMGEKGPQASSVQIV